MSPADKSLPWTAMTSEKGEKPLFSIIGLRLKSGDVFSGGKDRPRHARLDYEEKERRVDLRTKRNMAGWWVGGEEERTDSVCSQRGGTRPRKKGNIIDRRSDGGLPKKEKK